jgi:hypothetical protein
VFVLTIHQSSSNGVADHRHKHDDTWKGKAMVTRDGGAGSDSGSGSSGGGSEGRGSGVVWIKVGG